MKIVTNHNRRRILDASDLTVKEAEWFDYLDWDKLEKGEDSASFFRYRGNVYDLGEFQRTTEITTQQTQIGQSNQFAQWDGYQSDSFFSGIVIKYYSDRNFDPYDDFVIVGTYYE